MKTNFKKKKVLKTIGIFWALIMFILMILKYSNLVYVNEIFYEILFILFIGYSFYFDKGTKDE